MLERLQVDGIACVFVLADLAGDVLFDDGLDAERAGGRAGLLAASGAFFILSTYAWYKSALTMTRMSLD